MAAVKLLQEQEQKKKKDEEEGEKHHSRFSFRHGHGHKHTGGASDVDGNGASTSASAGVSAWPQCYCVLFDSRLEIYKQEKDFDWGFKGKRLQGGNGNGGGFSYQRSTDPSLNIQDNKKSILSVYPNPSNSFLHVNGLNASTNYRLYNILGAQVQSGTAKPNQAIDIDALQSRNVYAPNKQYSTPFCKKIGFVAIKN